MRTHMLVRHIGQMLVGPVRRGARTARRHRASRLLRQRPAASGARHSRSLCLPRRSKVSSQVSNALVASACLRQRDPLAASLFLSQRLFLSFSLSLRDSLAASLSLSQRLSRSFSLSLSDPLSASLSLSASLFQLLSLSRRLSRSVCSEG